MGLGEFNTCDKKEDNKSKEKIRKYDRIEALL